MPPLFAAALALVVTLGSEACGPKLDPVQVEADPTNDGTTTPTDPNGGGGGTGSTGLCGTTSTTIGYAANAQAVISKNCALSSCHGAGAQLPTLTDYAGSKTGIANGGLDDVKSARMPLGRTLTANEKCIIQSWAEGNYAP